MARETDSWADRELEGVDLGDARRNERAKTLLTRFAEKPTASIPLACQGWAETTGAYLMRMGRTCPDLDAALFFDPDEIHRTYLLMKKRMPKGKPKLNEVLRLVAQLGGFLARKGDGEPGAKTIREGLQRVIISAETLRALRSEAA